MLEGTNYWKNRPLNDERKDWPLKGTWIEGYIKSVKHPHRNLIIKALKKIKAKSLLEIGCNTGPNLVKIRRAFPMMDLAGIDINEDSIKAIPIGHVDSKVGNFLNLPWKNQFDVVLADAVLMYIGSDGIMSAMKEINRVCKKAVIIIDWYDAYTTLGTIQNFHWARNYIKLLEDIGFKVEAYKLTEKDWPRPIWVKNGWMFCGIRND